jgi:hypothetical protein
MKLISPLFSLIHYNIIKNANMEVYLTPMKLPLRLTFLSYHKSFGMVLCLIGMKLSFRMAKDLFVPLGQVCNP